MEARCVLHTCLKVLALFSQLSLERKYSGTQSKRATTWVLFVKVIVAQ
jgi:hypothetical protein